MPRTTTVKAKPVAKKTTALRKPVVRKTVHRKVAAPTPVKVVKKEAVETEIKAKSIVDTYVAATGRRKTSIARVRLFAHGNREITVNNKSLEQYFAQKILQKIILDPLEKMNVIDKFGVSILVKGGGLHSQAEAIRHGVSRALIKFNIDFRKRLKRAGFLTRDSRERERKKS